MVYDFPASTRDDEVRAPTYWSAFPDVAVKDSFRRRLVRCSDGYELTVFEAGATKTDPLLIINPHSVPFLLMARLAIELSLDYRVIGWETRGATFLADDIESIRRITSARVSEDVYDVVHALGLKSVHMIGACSAAGIISRTLKQHPVAAESVFLIAPAGVSEEHNATTLFQRVVVPMLEDVAEGRIKNLESLCANMQKFSMARTLRTPEEQTFSRLCYLNFESSLALSRYATLLQSLTKSMSLDEKSVGAGPVRFDEMCRQTNVTVFHCADDNIVSPKASLAAYERNTLMKLILCPTGGHFVFYKSAEMIAREIRQSICSAVRD